MKKLWFVYFIWCEGFVKIGYTQDIFKRMTAFQTGNPFNLLLLGAIICGSEWEAQALEATLHASFSQYSVSGSEWFEYDNNTEILDYINLNAVSYDKLVDDGYCKRFFYKEKPKRRRRNPIRQQRIPLEFDDIPL